MLYLCDTSALLDAKDYFYSFDFVPYFWDWLEEQGSAGRMKVCREAYDELKVDNGDFGAWIRKPEIKAALLLDEVLDEVHVNRVLDTYATDLTENELEACGNDAAIISYCLADATGRTLITAEVSKPSLQRHKRRMPDVAVDLGITTGTLISALRKLSFRVP